MGTLFQSAVEAHKAGRFDEALHIYEKIVEANPSLAQVQYLLGCLLMENKRFAEAYEHLQAAVKLKGDSPIYNGAFGSLLLNMKQNVQALEYLHKAAASKTANEEVFHSLCNALLVCGRYDEALEVATRASKKFKFSTKIVKDLLECCIAAANPVKLKEAMELGMAKGLVGHEAACSLEYRLAVMKKNKDEALEKAEKWMATFPESIEALKACASARKAAGKFDNSIDVLCKAYDKNPDDCDVIAEIGNWLVKSGRNHEAARFFETALKMNPESVNLEGALAFSLYKSAETPAFGDEIEAAYYHLNKLNLRPNPDLRAIIGMSSVLLNMLRIREGLVYFDKAVRNYPTVYANSSSRLFHDCYAWYFSKEEMYQRHLECVKMTRKLVGPATTGFYNVSDPGKRLKVGFVSGDFSYHPVAYFFISAFEAIKDDFDLYIYSNRKKEEEDDLTRRFEKGSKVFHSIFETADTDFQKLAIEDGIDVMIDLSGHTSLNRLKAFALRLAPVQASWLGYPNTTGLETMDFRISDDVTEPEGLTDQYSSERIIRLPGGFHLYRPPYRIPETIAPLPALKRKFITFGSFNNLKKASPFAFEAWAMLLKAVPNSRMIIKDRNLEGRYMRERVSSIFASYGIEPSRVTVLRLMRNNFDHMSAYSNIDIALDCYPYNGTTTTCEALVMGCPVITMMGDSHVSRVSSSILTHVGHTEWIAHSKEEFLSIGLGLIADLQKLSQIRSKLRSEMYASSLCDAQRMRRELGDAIRFMWRDWCSRESKAGKSATTELSNN
jgi:protein O-GlcNAc transferase